GVSVIIRLGLVQAKAIEVRAKPYVVGLLQPIEIRHILVLRVVAVVGHEVVRDSQAGEITIFSLEMERGPAAFELAGTIGSGNSQHLQSNVFAEAGLLRC